MAFAVYLGRHLVRYGKKNGIWKNTYYLAGVHLTVPAFRSLLSEWE